MKKLSFPKEKERTYIEKFVLKRKRKNIRELKKRGLEWTKISCENKMDYEVTWLGIPIIQNPYDMVLLQELIFKLRPDVIIEAGIAHGGSLIYYASLLELLGKGKVIGVDIEIRNHNRKLIEKHPMVKRTIMIEGDSVDKKIVRKIEKMIKPNDCVLVVLDSDHSKKHVNQELNTYKYIVTKGSYIVVFDTLMPKLFGLKGAREDFYYNTPLHAIK